MKEVRIYDGKGVDYKCFFNTRVALNSIYGNSEYISADQIEDRKWCNFTSILCIPGGVASPYNEDLGNEGMDAIRSFVENGGIYFGICAGAYFAAKNSEFGGIFGLPQINKIHLGLYEGKVVGPIFNTIEAKLKVKVICSDGVTREAFSNGGGVFKDPHLFLNTTVLANYQYWGQESSDAAFVKIQYGKGFVLASFVHFEDPEVWDSWKDYIKAELNLEQHQQSLVC